MACFFHSTDNMDSNLKLKLNPLAEQGVGVSLHHFFILPEAAPCRPYFLNTCVIF